MLNKTGGKGGVVKKILNERLRGSNCICGGRGGQTMHQCKMV